MIKVAWDVEELVALIDVYRKSDGKTVSAAPTCPEKAELN